MFALRVFMTTTLACAALCATATAASLPVNQRYADNKGKVSLLTRSGGKGYVNARTRCGRLADRRVRISGGRITSSRAARLRVTGTVTSRSTATLTIRRRGCAATFALKRVTAPQ